MNVDELVKWLRWEILAIEDNDVYKQPPAQVQINAPVALMQVELKARKQVLEEVLKRLT